jgi:hypothetical protein
MLEMMNDLGLNTTAPKRVITGRTKEGDIGSNKSKSQSIIWYSKVWKGFADFSFLIGDYESAMLPSQEHCPDSPFPVKLQMAILNMQFWVNRKGNPLKDLRTGEIVSNVEKQAIMYCLGNWQGLAVDYWYLSLCNEQSSQQL